MLIVAAVVIGVVRFVGGTGMGLDDDLGGAVALAGVFVAPALIASIAVDGRRVALFAAALPLLVLSSISIVTIPLVIVAAAFIVLALRMPQGPGGGRGALNFGVGVLVAVLEVGALIALIVHEDPRTVNRGTTTISSSDVVTWPEVAVSLGLAAAAVLLARFGFRGATGAGGTNGGPGPSHP